MVKTNTGIRRNSLKPDTSTSEECIELWALISMAVEFEPMLKQGDSMIHLPEPLEKMVACILAEMDVCKRVVPPSELFDKVFVFGTA